MCSSCRCPGASTGPSTRQSSPTRWEISPSRPFKSEIAERVAGEPLIDTVLEPGDALYLPRGTVHSALALGETSIHLTVGVHPLTRYELVRFLLEAVQDDPQLRVSLPVGADLGDPDVLAPHLETTVAALQEALAEVPTARIAERIETNLMQRTRPQALGPLAQLAAADALALDTPLRLQACSAAPARVRRRRRARAARVPRSDASTFPPARQMPSASSSIGASSRRPSFPVSTRPTS